MTSILYAGPPTIRYDLSIPLDILKRALLLTEDSAYDHPNWPANVTLHFRYAADAFQIVAEHATHRSTLRCDHLADDKTRVSVWLNGVSGEALHILIQEEPLLAPLAEALPAQVASDAEAQVAPDREPPKIPDVATMKRFFADYSEKTGEMILGLLPNAYQTYLNEGGRWGPRCWKELIRLDPKTVGRYLNAFKKAGLAEWGGISLP